MTIDEQINQLERKVNEDGEIFRQTYCPNIPPNVFKSLEDFLFFIGDKI